MVTAGEPLLYDKPMTRVFIANPVILERFALRLLLMDLNMEVVGEAADWSNTLALAPIRRTDMVLVDWNLLPNPANVAFEKLRKVSPVAQVIVLISHHDAQYQAALSSGADIFISNGEMSNRVIDSLRAAAASIPPGREAGQSLGVDADHLPGFATSGAGVPAVPIP